MSSAVLLHVAPGVLSRWRVTLPNGRPYVVTTYPGSEHIFVETDGERRRQISGTVAPNIHAAARVLIDGALGRAGGGGSGRLEGSK